jgi:hypothetical protein
MAVTWAATSVVEGVSSAGRRTKSCILTPTGTYTTGGDPIPIAALGFIQVVDLLQRGGGGLADPGFSVTLGGTPQAPTIRCFETNNTEIANATSITGRVFVARLEGY